MIAGEFEVWLRDPKRRALVMGVLNVTPDSFSDGGKFATTAAAVEHARGMSAAGADLIDIGGESTRPGSENVTAEEQIRRVVPVLEAVARKIPVVFSIDTTSAEVAKAALDAGAGIVNDISGARNDPRMPGLVARRQVPVILMHMQGTPATMQEGSRYGDVVAEVKGFLAERIAAARAAGVASEKILIDPGIGFGKNMEHNLTLLRQLGELKALDRPMVVGTSRKRFIGTITGETEPGKRLFGTAGSVAWTVANGADIVRVHDVGPMKQVVQIVRAIQSGWTEEKPESR